MRGENDMKILMSVLFFALMGSANAGGFGDLFKAVLDSQIKPKTENNQDITISSQNNVQPEKRVTNEDLVANILFGSSMSLEKEYSLGRGVAGSLLGVYPLVNDPSLQAYVNYVGKWVASHSDRAGISWKFGVTDDNDINSFAAPGGYILITKGLYRLLSNEAELAGVLAHEIVHVTEKHHLKILQQSSLIGLAGNSLNKKIVKSGNSKAGNVLLGNGAEVFARSLDKAAEFDCDSEGVVLATKAGYAPSGLVSVLQKIQTVDLKDARVSLLFSTHPSPNERLLSIDSRIGDVFENYTGLELVSRFNEYKLSN